MATPTPEVIDFEADGRELLIKLEALGIFFDYRGYRRYVKSAPAMFRKGRTPLSYLIFKAQSEGFYGPFYPDDN